MPARLLDMLKCPDHPGNVFFFKMTLTRSCVDKWGVSLREGMKADIHKEKPHPSFIQTSYVCPECDDLVHLEPKKWRSKVRAFAEGALVILQLMSEKGGR